VSNFFLLRNRGVFRQRPVFQNFTQCSPKVPCKKCPWGTAPTASATALKQRAYTAISVDEESGLLAKQGKTTFNSDLEKQKKITLYLNMLPKPPSLIVKINIFFS
jgi:hypothetical protein